MTEEQLKYVQEQLTAGVSPETLRATLLESGYDEVLVDELLQAAGVSSVSSAALATTIGLPKYGTFLSMAWSAPRERSDLLLLAIVGIAGWSALVTFLTSFVDGGAVQTLGMFANAASGLIYIYLLAAILAVWLRADCVAVADGLRWANKNFSSIWWMAIVLFLVQFTGYLLFIIPGLVILGYTLLAYPVRVAEERRGLAALVRSTALVYGNWWGVLGRTVVLGLTFIPLYILGILIFFLLSSSLGISPENVWLESIFWLIGAYTLAISAKANGVLYQSLVTLDDTFVAEQWSRTKVTYTILAWLGAPATVVLFVLGSVLLSSITDVQSSARDAAMQVMLSESYFYYNINDFSYEGFCQHASMPIFSEGNNVNCIDGEEGFRVYVSQGAGGYVCINHEAGLVELERQPSSGTFECE